MNPDKQRLIQDLMTDGREDARQAETLLAAAGVLRRRRRERQVTRALLVAGIAALATLCVQRWTTRDSRVVTEVAKHSPSAPPSALSHRLSDDELLALFPDTPVGLATLSDGRKRLIFPRPGDEARFITHL